MAASTRPPWPCHPSVAIIAGKVGQFVGSRNPTFLPFRLSLMKAAWHWTLPIGSSASSISSFTGQASPPSELNKILSWPIWGQLLTHFNPSFKYFVSIPSRQKLSTISRYQLLLQSLLSFCIHPVDLKECAWKPLWLALDIQMVQTRCDAYYDNKMVITNDILLLWESICKVGIK